MGHRAPVGNGLVKERNVIIMKKNFKIVLGLTFGLAVSAAVAQPTKVDAKVKLETAQQAGKRLYKAETLAYKSKKKVTRVFNYKAKSQGKAEDFAYKIDCAALKAQYGKYYNSNETYCGALDYLYTKSSVKKVKKGIYAYKITINGKNAGFRKDYRNTESDRKLVAEIKSFTKGQSQFEKAWTTMVWFRARSCYDCGRHQKTTVYDLYKRDLQTDCDGLAGMYAYFAHRAGVKKVGCVWYNSHMWNWIEVDGVKYYVDYQGVQTGGVGSVKYVVDYYTNKKNAYDRWGWLYDLDKWYRENVDADAKRENSCKNLWDKMSAKQKKDFKKSYPLWDTECDYQFTCESYAKSNFRPLKVFCDRSNGDHTVSQSKKWKYSR